MATVYRQFPVHVSAATAWERIADLGSIDSLLTFLGPATVTGDRRTCSMPGMGDLEELILSVDADRRRVAYAIQSSPLDFEHHSASMTVTTDPAGKTQLTWITDFAPSTLGAQVEGLIDMGVASLIETLAA